MRLNTLRTLFMALTKEYFGNATVRFARSSMKPKPDLPLVQLSFGPVERPHRPNYMVVDGYLVGMYGSFVRVDIDLFTHGSPVVYHTNSAVFDHENTAVEDLSAFEDYLNSEYVLNWQDIHSVAVQVEGEIQDLSGIINETTYEYRARMTVRLSYTSYATEHAGVLSEDSVVYPTGEYENNEEVFAPGAPVRKTSTTGNFGSPEEDREKRATVSPAFSQTSSGGGTQILAQLSTGYFTEAEVEFVPYPGESGEYSTHGFAVKGHLDDAAKRLLDYLQSFGFHLVSSDFDDDNFSVYVSEDDVHVDVDTEGKKLIIYRGEREETPQNETPNNT